jgi:hypothetical protein
MLSEEGTIELHALKIIIVGLHCLSMLTIDRE